MIPAGARNKYTMGTGKRRFPAMQSFEDFGSDTVPSSVHNKIH